MILRLRQGLRALRPALAPGDDAFARQWLTQGQYEAFSALSAHDRGHLVRVARELAQRAPQRHDLIVSGLLHDIGKQAGRHKVRLADRVAKVILERSAPRLLAWLARPDPSRFRSGIYLAVHHPELGAEQAARLGCTERAVWLIKNHENDQIADPDLALLIGVDRSTP